MPETSDHATWSGAWWGRVAVNVLLGQLMSLCLSGTGVCSQYLATKFGVKIPMTQSFATFSLICLVYGTWLGLRKGEKNFVQVLKRRWWKYLILGIVDVEGNFLFVLSYQYTNLISIQLLDSWAVVVCLILAFFCLGVSFRKTHMAGLVICVVGLGFIVWADESSDSEDGPTRLEGDLICLAGATLYGVANTGQEYLLRTGDRFEVLGMLGFFGAFVSGVQVIVLERTALAEVDWSEWGVGFVLALFACLYFVFYSLMTEVIARAGSVMFNLSLLTADFFSLAAGVLVFQYSFKPLYLGSFAVVLVGSAVYSVREPIQTGRVRLPCARKLFEGIEPPAESAKAPGSVRQRETESSEC